MMMNDWSFGFGVGTGPVMMIIFTVIMVYPFWRICSKAGFPGVLSLFILIPLANLVFLYWLALAQWPNVPEGQS